MTTREPEYDDRDRALISASFNEQHQPRGPHGYTMAEATDPEHQFDWKVDPLKRDFIATLLKREQALWKKQYPHEDPDSFVWSVSRD